MLDEGLEDIGAAAETGAEAWDEAGAASGVETLSGAEGTGVEGTGVEAATIGLPDGDPAAGGFAVNVSVSSLSSNGTSRGSELLPVGIEDEDMK